MLARAVLNVVNDADQLAAMSTRSRQLSPADAARLVVETIEKNVNGQ